MSVALVVIHILCEYKLCRDIVISTYLLRVFLSDSPQTFYSLCTYYTQMSSRSRSRIVVINEVTYVLFIRERFINLFYLQLTNKQQYIQIDNLFF